MPFFSAELPALPRFPLPAGCLRISMPGVAVRCRIANPFAPNCRLDRQRTTFPNPSLTGHPGWRPANGMRLNPYRCPIGCHCCFVPFVRGTGQIPVPLQTPPRQACLVPCLFPATGQSPGGRGNRTALGGTSGNLLPSPSPFGSVRQECFAVFPFRQWMRVNAPKFY